MEPDSDDARYPHGFACPKCGGCVDAQVLPDAKGQRSCGGMVRDGMSRRLRRCGERIPAEQPVCDNCMYVAAVAYSDTERGRFILSALLGDALIRKGEQEARQRRGQREERKREERRASTLGSVVYYARLGHNHIKIGTTSDLSRRMVELRVVNPANLLAAEPGGYELEAQRHDQFRKWRYAKRKEDFGEGADLLEHIAAVRAEHGSPYELAARTTSTSA